MQIPDELARRLVALRRHLGRREAPVLDLAAVDEVVAHVGCSIPDDVLAYLAALGVAEEGGALSREVDFDSAVEDLGFEPVIVRAPPAQPRRVAHPKLGVGVVLGEAEGKLRIDFGAAGNKTIAASFVEDAP
jgi:hypothetical protein